MHPIEIPLTQLLALLDEDPQREELKKTPQRMLTMYRSFIKSKKTSEDWLDSLHPVDSNEKQIISLNQIPFCSLCEHHLVPFFGTVDFLYLPGKNLIGLSRIMQYIKETSKRLCIQETLSQRIAQTLYNKLKPRALMIYMKAHHTCLDMLGHQGAQAQLTTQNFLGDRSLKTELVQHFNAL